VFTVCGETNNLSAIPPVGVARSGETSDLKLRVRERFPPQCRAVQRMDPAPDPELAQPLAGSGRVVRGTGVHADPQDAIEGFHRPAAVTAGQPGATQILQRGRRRQRPRAGSEDRRRPFQVGLGLVEEAPGVRGGSRRGRHTGVEFVPASGDVGHGLREFLVAGREGHPDQQGIVGGLHREEREQRQPLGLAERAEPVVGLVRVARCRGVNGEVPRGELADDGSSRGQHDLGDLGNLMSPALISEVELDAAERHR
jgi:hypothetical protein